MNTDLRSCRWRNYPMKSCLILKPPLIKSRSAGAVLGILELSGCRIEDIFSIPLQNDDIYRFFELQLKYPSKEEVESFKNGLCLVVGFDKWIKWNPMPNTYFSTSEDIGISDCKFWFGG